MLSIQEIPINEHKAIVLAYLFGVALPKRYDDKQWRKLELKIEKYGHFEITLEKHSNITYQTHEMFIKRFQTAYGFDFTHYISLENKGKVKALVDALYADEKATFDQLAYDLKLMTNLESIAYKSAQDHIKNHGTNPVPEHHKHSINDLL